MDMTSGREAEYWDEDETTSAAASGTCCVDCGAPLCHEVQLTGSRVLTFPLEHVCRS